MKKYNVFFSAYLHLNRLNPNMQMVSGIVYFVFTKEKMTKINDAYISNKTVSVTLSKRDKR